MSRSPSQVLLPSVFSPVLDLNSLNGQGSDNRITTTFEARIMVTATAVIRNASAGPQNVTCRIQINDGSGPSDGFTIIGNSVGSKASLTAGTFATLPVIGSIIKDPGTYNVALECTADFDLIVFDAGDLAVVAIAN